MKETTSFRLTQEARKLLKRIADSLGISQGAVLEQAIRKEAQERKLK